MKVEEAKYSIAELVDWIRRRDLVVNKEYQRGGGLWPAPAKSYFIDTIIKEFPFPKIYFHERVDMSTKRPRREIVDGQQRLSTIVDFVEDKFTLGTNAGELRGKRYSELTQELQEAFYSYSRNSRHRTVRPERIARQLAVLKQAMRHFYIQGHGREVVGGKGRLESCRCCHCPGCRPGRKSSRLPSSEPGSRPARRRTQQEADRQRVA